MPACLAQPYVRARYIRAHGALRLTPLPPDGRTDVRATDVAFAFRPFMIVGENFPACARPRNSPPRDYRLYLEIQRGGKFLFAPQNDPPLRCGTQRGGISLRQESTAR